MKQHISMENVNVISYRPSERYSWIIVCTFSTRVDKAVTRLYEIPRRISRIYASAAHGSTMMYD